MNIGFSASTGLLTAFHHVHGWSFKIGGRAQELDITELPSLAGKSKIVHRKGFAVGITLAIACGRRPLEPQKFPAELFLVDWMRELHSQGQITRAIDPTLDYYDPVEADLVHSLGLLCCDPHPDYRPSMRRVVQFLLGDANFLHYHLTFTWNFKSCAAIF
ncbi:hypothetical protein Q3G72_028180 [Acer saccharum]|nr:hypothetical protein Q3G72_028180 [Acer saccharum]